MPTGSQLHRDSRLTNLSLAYRNSDFVGATMFPVVPVGKESDYYAVYGKENFDIRDTKRAKGAAYQQITHAMSDTQYTVTEHGLKEFIDDDDITNADPIFNLRTDAAENVMDGLLLRREYDIAAKLFTTSSFTNDTTLSGKDQWSDNNSDPVKNIFTGKETIKGAVGVEPNTLLIGYQVANKLRQHPSLLEKLSYNKLQVLSDEDLAAVLQIDRVIVGKAQYNSATEGQTRSIANYVWGKNALLAYVNPNPGRKRVSLGYCFQFQAVVSDRWRETELRGEYVRSRFKADYKLTEELCGYYISAAIA